MKPIDVAVSNGCPEIVEALVNAKANIGISKNNQKVFDLEHAIFASVGCNTVYTLMCSLLACGHRVFVSAT